MLNDSIIAASRYLSRLNLNTDTAVHSIKTFWCRVVFGRAERFNTKNQRHSFFELHLCISGSCEFLLDGKAVQLDAGQYILVPPGQNHTILSVSEDFEKFVWGFLPEDDSEAELLSLGCVRAEIPVMAEASLYESVERILCEGDRGSLLDMSIVKNELSYIYVTLSRKLALRAKVGQVDIKAGVRSEAVKKLIADNLASNLSVSDIASQFYLSERQLERICQSEFHMTVGELKRSLQAEAIRTLLSDTTLPLGEIARLTGFSDRYSMSKFFKKAEGMPPAKYRSSILE